MTFTEHDKLKALAIVNIFETSKPFGDYAAVAVLDDGAGVSYGMAQFTHRSGSLRAVVERYLASEGRVGRDTLIAAMPLLRSKTTAAVNELARDERFKRALRAAAVTREMKDAQHFVAADRYLRPALEICGEMGFCEPLSLAVVYDSVVHGAWDRLASRVRGAAASNEKAWITEYVRRRHIWLTAIARLKATNYRTRFFLSQIAIANWALKLPLTVHGVKLSAAVAVGAVAEAEAEAEAVADADAEGVAKAEAETTATAPAAATFPAPAAATFPAPAAATFPAPAAAPDPDLLAAASSSFDRVDGVVSAVIARTDRAKSLWTTVWGSASQAAWAVFGFLVGLPREVWITVAVIAGALTLLFLYRQIVLGRIREVK